MDGERSMTKSELIELIAAKQSHLPAKDVELAVKQILEIMEHGHMINPPRNKPPTPPPVPVEASIRESESGEDLPPGLAGAPA